MDILSTYITPCLKNIQFWLVHKTFYNNCLWEVFLLQLEFVQRITNKKVLLRERKRHTARRVTSARYAALCNGGVPWVGGTPSQVGGTPSQVGGYPISGPGGYPILGQGGYPISGRGYPISVLGVHWVPPPYRPGWGVPWVTPYPDLRWGTPLLRPGMG